MPRTDYYHDPSAPKANAMVPAVTVVIANSDGAILLQRRSDNQLWALPGGAVEIGETVRQAVVRETLEETGLDVDVKHLVGIYSDPQHVIEYSDGEVRQQFSMCFAATVAGGSLEPSSESLDIRFVPSSELDLLPIHPSTRLRIDHYLANFTQPYIE